MDPLQELAEANVELGNRSPSSQASARSLRSARQLPAPVRHFSAGLFGACGVLLVLGIIGLAWHYGQRDVTLEKFNRVPVGATVAQVNELIGFEGTLLSSSQESKPIQGLSGMNYHVQVDLYSWQDRGGGSMIGAFGGGVLVSKSQTGLK